METEAKILGIIDELRPFLISDGGNLEYVKFEDGIVYVRLAGACANCGFSDVTLKDGIQQNLKKEIQQLKQLQNLADPL